MVVGVVGGGGCHKTTEKLKQQCMFYYATIHVRILREKVSFSISGYNPSEKGRPVYPWG
jgi:hypothetical protein